MFETFATVFVADSRKPCGRFVGSSDPDLDELFRSFAGVSFNGGIYRVLCSEEANQWDSLVSVAFPSFRGRISCFALDWLGRLFALDSARLSSGKPSIIMFEPGSGEALEIPCNILQFHESELIEHQEEALAKSFYEAWRKRGGLAPAIYQCVGYKIPLFLAGSDTVENLELSDLDVYWTISAQLIQQSRGLLPGASVGRVKIDQ
jgi:hypothetical protein